MTRKWREDKSLQIIGVIQEQHAERCRLFAQWKSLDWPIVQDPFNLIPTRAVPVVIAIDEYGVVRSTRPNPRSFAEQFMEVDFPKPEHQTKPLKNSSIETMTRIAKSENTAEAWRQLGDAIALWKPGQESQAIEAYQEALSKMRDAKSPDMGALLFRLGVVHRARHESAESKSSDFLKAVDYWGRALDADPNHYIYRRRIQQYGPRLMKPYPFYDWVTKAREEIKSRGEEPVKLLVEPGGAEIAQPDRSFKAAGSAKNPDAGRRINRDSNHFITISSVSVPAEIKPNATARLHVEFRPSNRAHWNNESEAVQVWVEQPDGWQIDKNLFELDQAKEPESTESRKMEFEVKLPAIARAATLKGYALYYVCEEQGGQCLYLRQDSEIPIRISK